MEPDPSLAPYDPDLMPNSQEEMDRQRALFIAHNTTVEERIRWVEDMIVLFADVVLADKIRRGLLPPDYVPPPGWNQRYDPEGKWDYGRPGSVRERRSRSATPST